MTNVAIRGVRPVARLAWVRLLPLPVLIITALLPGKMEYAQLADCGRPGDPGDVAWLPGLVAGRRRAGRPDAGRGGSARADSHRPAGGHAGGDRALCLCRRIAGLRPGRH